MLNTGCWGWETFQKKLIRKRLRSGISVYYYNNFAQTLHVYKCSADKTFWQISRQYPLVDITTENFQNIINHIRCYKFDHLIADLLKIIIKDTL